MKSSTYYVHMKTKILIDFQICISVPLRRPFSGFLKKKKIVVQILGKEEREEERGEELKDVFWESRIRFFASIFSCFHFLTHRAVKCSILISLSIVFKVRSICVEYDFRPKERGVLWSRLLIVGIWFRGFHWQINVRFSFHCLLFLRLDWSDLGMDFALGGRGPLIAALMICVVGVLWSAAGRGVMRDMLWGSAWYMGILWLRAT